MNNYKGKIVTFGTLALLVFISLVLSNLSNSNIESQILDQPVEFLIDQALQDQRVVLDGINHNLEKYVKLSGQEGFEVFVEKAKTATNSSLRKEFTNLLAFFKDTEIDPTSIINLILEKGATAKHIADLESCMLFYSNLGMIGKWNDDIEEFLIESASDPEFDFYVWPILKDNTNRRWYIEGKDVAIVPPQNFPGKAGQESISIQNSNGATIYIKDTHQGKEAIENLIFKEAGDDLQWKETNEALDNLRLCAITAIFHQKSEKGLGALRSIAQNEKSSLVKKSINFHFKVIEQYGSMENYHRHLDVKIIE